MRLRHGRVDLQRPGAHREGVANVGDADFERIRGHERRAQLPRERGDGLARVRDHGAVAGVEQRAARLEVMDEQGVESVLLFPTFGVTVEHALRHDACLEIERRAANCSIASIVVLPIPRVGKLMTRLRLRLSFGFITIRR